MQILQGLGYIIVKGKRTLTQVLHIISYLSWVLITLDEGIFIDQKGAFGEGTQLT
jgi:hypothetical protein